MTTSHRRPRGLARTPRWAAGLVAAAVLLVSTGLSTALAPRSVADTVPPDASLPATVSSDPLPTAQINGVVWASVVVGNTVYAGGEFTRARPAGAAPGTQEVVRSNLLAFSLSTGVLTSFAPTLNGKVKDIEAAPDGSAVYIAGQFTTVNGSTRNRVAAFSTSTGSLIGGFAPSVNGTVNGLAVTSNAVFIGGAFSAINGTTRLAVGSVDRSSGATRPFNPSIPSGSLQKLAASPDGSKVVIGGNFTAVNGSSNPGYGLAMLDAVSGASLPMPVNSVVRDANTNAAITDLVGDATGFYGTGFSYNLGQGNFEGTFKADWNGNLVWMEDCHGDTYSAFPAGDEVYVASHAHYCGNVAGFPQTRPSWTFQRGMAFSNDVRGTVSRDVYGYPSFEGQPRPALLTWFPDINAGTYTGQSQGPWSVTGNDDYVVFAGEFTTVNNRGQQGLVRFARGSLAPHDDGPRLGGANFVPTVRNFAQGVRVGWLANHDRDNEQLTYAVIKNGNVGTPVYTTTRRSTFWQRPYLAFLDTNVTPGQSYTYQLRATDPKGNNAYGSAVSITAGGGPSLTTYDRTVLADAPELYWPFNETSGSTATDLANSFNGTRAAGVSTGVPGAVSPGTAYRFPGTSANSVAATTAKAGPYVFSAEAWFRTTSSSGGKILGFGSTSAGDSGSYDRHLYLGNSGQVHFGVHPGTARVVSSPGTYRDGQWHHVVGTLSPAGQFLYVDGALVGSSPNTVYAHPYDGYWKAGGDSLGSWPGAGSSGYLNGDLDNVAVYATPLSAGQVSAHYAARSGTPANQPPNASFTTSASDLTVSVNGSGSSDPDGSITAYAWTFGDGGTASGATASHAYAAAGTYTVGLTVTDNNGATSSTTRSVTVTAPPGPGAAFASDAFNRTLSTGLGSADTGGSWTVSTASGFAVESGAGQWKLSAPGTSRTAYLGSATATSSDLTTSLSTDKTATGGTVFAYVLGRRVATNTEYRSLVRLSTSNSVSVTLEALRGSSSAIALSGAVTVPGTLAPGTVIHVRMQTFGTSPTTLRSKVWLGSASEPTTWTVSATDSYAGLQAAGAVGLSGYLSGGATNAPVTLSVYDVDARPVQ